MRDNRQVGGRENVELVRVTWDAIARGDLDTFARLLAPDAQWRAVDDGEWNCDSREDVLAVMERNLAEGLGGRIEETFEFGERVMVAFRPYEDTPLQRPLDNGIAYVVVTMRDGVIREVKGCVDRVAALTYASVGELPDA
ncbi:MAG TPA: nuclear transport factor 2 family protein [Solirubrobacteraceae bacterium]|nr:nuclear transport factor 2 family protein [Solirubrobacteraceae bacterium]